MDPLAEQTMDSYGYCYNNPINLIDPDGMSPTDYENQQSSIISDPPKPNGNPPSGWTRLTGGLQMVGGALEAVVGGVGGVVTAETGIGAAIGYAVLLNGIDNTVTGAKQMWTGQDEETLLHQGVKETSKALGASEKTSERIATGVDATSIVVGGVSSVKSGLKVLDKNTKFVKSTGGTKQWIRLDK